MEVEFISSGHFCVNIAKRKSEIHVHSEENAPNITYDMSTTEKRKVLVKVLKQFGHVSYSYSCLAAKLLDKTATNYADTSDDRHLMCANCDVCMANKRLSS